MLFNLFQQLAAHIPILTAVIQVHHVIDQEGAGGANVGQRIHGVAELIGPIAAAGMPAGQGATKLFQMVVVIQLRRMAAGSAEYRKGKAVAMKQGGTVLFDGGNHRQVPRHQEQAEGMFFQDLFIAPALWTIELDDDRRALFLAHLVDPVLETVQLQQATVTEEAGGVHGVEHVIRGEVIKGMAHKRLRPAPRRGQATPRHHALRGEPGSACRHCRGRTGSRHYQSRTGRRGWRT